MKIQLSLVVCRHWWQKTKGLLGKTKIEGIYFKTRFGIHTFGLTQKIDVLILDHHNRVQKMCKGLKPNRIWWWNPRFEQVVELAHGEIEKRKIRQFAIIRIDEK